MITAPLLSLFLLPVVYQMLKGRLLQYSTNTRLALNMDHE